MKRLTQEEFVELLARNPHLSVQPGTPQQISSTRMTIGNALLSAPKSGKAGLGLAGQKRKKYGNMRVAVLSSGEAVFESICVSSGQLFPKGKQIFDSEKEYHRWRELGVLQDAGYISGLELQKELEVMPSMTTASGEKIRGVKYVADFFYTRNDGTVVVEDVKACDKQTGKAIATQVFALKWKLLKYKYPQYLFRIEV